MWNKCSIFCCLLLGCITIQAQRVVSECTITYGITSVNKIDTALEKSLSETIKTVLIKGNLAKIEITNPQYYQASIFDKITGKATIIREIGGNKFLSKLSAEKWIAQNAIYANSKLVLQDSTTKILGYDCKMATIYLTNTTTIQLFYVPLLNISVKEGEWQFKDVPGLVLQYNLQEGNKNLLYKANRISFNPVPANVFTIPNKGYRLL